MVLGSGIRDPRSGIRDPEKIYSGSRIPDPGVKKHPIPDPGSGSATLIICSIIIIINSVLTVSTASLPYDCGPCEIKVVFIHT
jgi:hypothetical protein